MKKFLEKLTKGEILDHEEAKEVLTKVATGMYSDIEISSFLTVYMMRPITAGELAGFREALLELAVPVDLNDYDTMDVCGTGGDEKNTLNISTLTAFVAAGAGAKIVKHGNFATSSISGSSDIMQYFGYSFSNDNDKLKKELEIAGICYLHAPMFHPALKNVAPVRKALRLKTFFNILGPMVNPAHPSRQLIGIFNRKVQDLYAGVYASTTVRYFLVHSLDGYDEISLTSEFRLITNESRQIISPAELSFGYVSPSAIRGGQSLHENAAFFRNILEGRGTEEQNKVVTANAAYALQCYFTGKTLEEATVLAEESLLAGKAQKAFQTLMDIQP
ncbi:MAG TPA: anthranilate phosphoribosyltransferase [Bacteroidetes bacterium]|nr:anthranilate phosphoribosyltransferase [Bacteroidota bacterium]